MTNNELAMAAALLWLMALSSDVSRIVDRSKREWVHLLGSLTSAVVGLGATILTAAYLWVVAT